VAGPVQQHPHVLYEQRIALRRSDDGAHPVLEAGKVANVRLAAPLLDGLLLEPGRPFSFWRTVGPLRAADGYRHGMELRGGCVVPSLGGGICVLTNALFAAAVQLGWTIIERHGHTLEVVAPPPGALWGVDATAVWPDLDLRFAVPHGDGSARLTVRVEGDTLVLRVHGERPVAHRVVLDLDDGGVTRSGDSMVRRGSVLRRVDDGPAELVATNAKRLLDGGERKRTCLTCDRLGCDARVVVPVGEIESAGT
jgi:vancomycin resistance protein VanW